MEAVKTSRGGPGAGEIGRVEAVCRQGRIDGLSENHTLQSKGPITSGRQTSRDMPAYHNYLQHRRRSIKITLEQMGGSPPGLKNHQRTPSHVDVSQDTANPFLYEFNKSMQQLWEAGAGQGHRGSLTARTLDMANIAPPGPSTAFRTRGPGPSSVYMSSTMAILGEASQKMPLIKFKTSIKFKRKMSLTPMTGKWRKLCRFIVLLFRTWKHHSMRTEDVLGKMNALDLLVDSKAGHRKDLWFDLSKYKAHKEAPAPQEARRILLGDPSTRTPDELHYLQVALKNYRSIEEYPVRIQRLMTERAFYQGLNAKRVIIREGYLPTHFYFILSGSVVVSLLDTARNINKTLYFLSRGDSFGELALVNHTRREITVVSKEKVELLVLSSEDFTEIFLSGGLNDPFLRSLPFLEGWPLDRLERNTEKAIFSFFKRNAVLTKDTRRAEWIYIIKSGSCRLLKRMAPKYSRGRRRKQKKEKLLNLVENAEVHQVELARRLQTEVDKANARWRGNNQPRLNIPTDGARGCHPLADSFEIDFNICGPILPYSEDTSAPPDITSLDNLDDVLNDSVKAPPGGRIGGRGTSAKFVVVQVLTKGTVFGLEALMCGDQPTFSLVSNGAEVIMIQKRFFLANAPQSLINKLRNEVYPYPSEEELRCKLKVQLSWDRRRKATLDETVRKLRMRKMDIHDSRSGPPVT